MNKARNMTKENKRNEKKVKKKSKLMKLKNFRNFCTENLFGKTLTTVVQLHGLSNLTHCG